MYNFKILNFFLFIDDSDFTTAPRITEFSFVSIPRKTFIDGFEKMNNKHVIANEDFNDEQMYEDISIHVPINVYTRQLNPNINEKEWSRYENSVRCNPTSKYLF